MDIVSFGAGINSTALLLGLLEHGRRPDYILFADTGGERPETYLHLNLMDSWCASVGFPRIQCVTYSTSLHGTLEGECLDNETLPSKAFGFGGCSHKWKRRPMDRFIESLPEATALWGRGERINRLIGIHAGETKRGRIPDDKRYVYQYPLRDEWIWFQQDCIDAHERNGIAIPGKSACFFCPSTTKKEVLSLAKTHPELFDRAVEIERVAIASGELRTVKGLGRHWTWGELVAATPESRANEFSDAQAPVCDYCLG